MIHGKAKTCTTFSHEKRLSRTDARSSQKVLGIDNSRQTLKKSSLDECFKFLIETETPKLSAIDVESLEEIEIERKIKLKIRRFEKYAWATIENGEYLKYQISVADDQSFANQEDETIFELKRLPMINPFERPPEKHHLELDPIKSLSKLKNQYQEEAPSGFINQKRFIGLLSDFEGCKAFESAERFTIPYTVGFISTGQKGLVRSMHVLQPSTCELLDERNYQDLVDIFNSAGVITNSINDFAVSKEVTEEFLLFNKHFQSTNFNQTIATARSSDQLKSTVIDSVPVIINA
ncbi:hypothetical protein ACTXT7_011852 [Hymenolepis weldensis]